VVRAYIGVGANLGDATEQVRAAAESLRALGAHWQCSPLYHTAPQDADGPYYVNAVVGLDTSLTAPALLVSMQAIENAAGRERPYRNAPRTLDLDLLLYGSAVIRSPALQIPHPRMWERAFVLVPLRDIAPNLVPDDRFAAVVDQVVERL
jgi:2-amino-4-hydroxy-6-hydroxymethyldihydropteridine diphosphokinase